mgnify:CR=1 FL=1
MLHLLTGSDSDNIIVASLQQQNLQVFLMWSIEHVNEYPTMHYFETPGHTQSMIAHMILTEYFWKVQ